jgi:hypothetical protein
MAGLDFIRVLFAFAFVFLALPLLAEGHKIWRGEPFDRPASEWVPIVLRAFAFASFAAEILGLVLGSIRLCLPGLLVTSAVIWATRGFLIAHQVRSGLKEEYAQSIWRPLVALLEPQQSSELQNQLKGMRFQSAHLPVPATIAAALLTSTLFAFAHPAIQQVSFEHPESYVRAVSLAALSQGKTWEPDASVAFLAPVVCFSGLDAASVIRFTGPIFITIFAGLIAICAWQAWRTTIAAIATLGLFLCLALAYSNGPWEMLPALISIVYWTAAAVNWPYSFKYSLIAGATGLMIAPGQWIAIVICFLLIAGVLACSWVRGRWKIAGPVVTTACSLFAVSLILLLWDGVTPDPQLTQYEAAARTCEKITRQFHRNEWLVISPFQELAFTYGHGWHLELSEFVSQFHRTDVSKPNFAFPYEAPDVFFFVERKPLRPGAHHTGDGPAWRYAPAEASEWTAFLYSDPIGRASLEYQAAELLNAYANSHKNLSVFYQDDDLAVYHLAANSKGT